MNPVPLYNVGKSRNAISRRDGKGNRRNASLAPSLRDTGADHKLLLASLLRLLAFSASSTQHLRYFSQQRFRGKWLHDEAERGIESAQIQNRLGWLTRHKKDFNILT